MRALTGAIIAAGAMIGLGLAAIGLGTRYATLIRGQNGTPEFIRFVQLDTPMMLILVVLITGILIGLAMTFLGLAYHHERRLREHHLHTSGKSGLEV